MSCPRRVVSRCTLRVSNDKLTTCCLHNCRYQLWHTVHFKKQASLTVQRNAKAESKQHGNFGKQAAPTRRQCHFCCDSFLLSRDNRVSWSLRCFPQRVHRTAHDGEHPACSDDGLSGHHASRGAASMQACPANVVVECVVAGREAQSPTGSIRSSLFAKYANLFCELQQLSSTSKRLQDTPLAAPEVPKKKKRGFVRTVALSTTGLLVLFYVASPVVAFNNERYKDFFFESVPFGELILDRAEEYGLDDALRIGFLQSQAKNGRDAAKRVQDAVAKKVEDLGLKKDEETKARQTVREKADRAKAGTVEKIADVKDRAKEVTKGSKERAKEVAQTLKTQTSKAASATSKKVQDVVDAVSPGKSSEKSAVTARPSVFSEGIESLVEEVEAALSGKPIERLTEATPTPEQPADSPPEHAKAVGRLYTAELPVGFEPPPGYSRPKPPSQPPSSASSSKVPADEIPLLAPTVAASTLR